MKMIQVHCSRCQAPLMVEIVDEYDEKEDAFDLLRLATCATCIDRILVERRYKKAPKPIRQQEAALPYKDT